MKSLLFSFAGICCAVSAAIAEEASPPSGIPEAVVECIGDIELIDLSNHAACLDKTIAAGPESIRYLAEQLELTVAQPELEVLTEPRVRLRQAPEQGFELTFRIRNRSPRPAIVRPGAMSCAAELRFESFGLTWDAGLSSVQAIRPQRQRNTYLLLDDGEHVDLSFTLPVAIKNIGRYTLEFTASYDGPLTIPQDEAPAWTADGAIVLEYLPERRQPRRDVGGLGEIRVDLGDTEPAYWAGKPIRFEFTVSNVSRDPIVLPSETSFFAAPYFYVVVDDLDRIVAYGNPIPIEDVRPEPSSTQPRLHRLNSDLRLAGVIREQLREGAYRICVGCTVRALPGGVETWTGDAISSDRFLEIIKE